MTNFKRFSAAIAATLMAATLSVPMMVSADATPGSVTFTGISETDKATHSYTAYKIFAGKAEKTDFTGTAELTEVSWANPDGAADFLAALKADTTIGGDFADCTTAAAVAKVLAGYSAKSTEAKTFAELAIANKSKLATAGTYANGAIALAEDGYYVIEETALGDITTNGSVTAYLLGVYDSDTGAEINVKASLPTFQKKIADINDTTDDAQSAWQDTADHDIGDLVPFQLKATLPSTYDTYKAYQLIFHDDLNKNSDDEDVFTLDQSSIVVYADINGDGACGTGEAFTLTNDYTIITPGSETSTSDFNCDFEIAFTNLKATSIAGSITKDTPIYVEYKATLNENAVIGSAGNWNDAYLEYSNNPNQADGGDTSKTVEDRVGAFTYKVVINKTDGATDKPLTGAEFTLTKKLEDGSTKDITVVKSDDGTSFSFSGLDDGTYILTETKQPSGYNPIEPIEFTVTATHTQDPATLELTALNGTPTEDGAITLTANLEDGSLTGTVENNSGSSLPSTGGIGTTLFYLGGGAMVAVAGIYLISKKRMKNEE